MPVISQVDLDVVVQGCSGIIEVAENSICEVK
jgi:hypothetical protein